MKRHLLVSLVTICMLVARAHADDYERLRVGLQADGRIVVPTNQILEPAGKQVTFRGRPVDLLLIDNDQTLVVKDQFDLRFVDVQSGQVRQSLPSQAAGRSRGLGVVGLASQGERIYVSDAHDRVMVAKRQPDAGYVWEDPIPLTPPAVGGLAHPAGLAFQNETLLWVASTRGNCVQLLNVETRRVEQVIPVGVAPYGVLRVAPDKVYVSNWGGNKPAAGDVQLSTADSPVRVDPRTGIANHGSVSVLRLVDGKWTLATSIEVGLHPCGMALGANAKFAYLANANSDTVSVIDGETDAVVETIPCRPEARLPFGSGSNAVALSPDGRLLYVANGTNNCLAVVELGAASRDPKGQETEPGADSPTASRVAGLIPCGWYPGAVAVTADGRQLFVANVKGHGSLGAPPPDDKRRNSRQYLGSLTIVDVPDATTLEQYTQRVHANNRLAYSLAGLESPREGVAPVCVPERHGEPSLIEHVVYVIKENRTYDQVFGDIETGNGDPSLCIFGQEVTPNHHRLVREFTLFDNFYCSGVLSADGHQWINEAYVTDYLEKSFGNFTRSYPYDGGDPLAHPATGFLWDHVLAHGKTLRNYGEFIFAKYDPANATWADLYADHQQSRRTVRVSATAAVPALVPHSHPTYTGFPLTTPDVYRADLFIEELRQFEEQGTLPNLLYVFLPCDHTEGTSPGYPTPRAMVADNDLALGRIVEALSHGKFWPKTCIFVVEDDPQDGFDHVDGHRTVGLAISPYTKRKFVDSTCYNQTSMVKTIELMLGLAPMNQLDLCASAMRDCFQVEPDLTPYECLPNNVPLDEMNRPLGELHGQALRWAQASLELDFSREDLADEDTLNRIVWFAMQGDAPYPGHLTGQDDDDEEDEARGDEEGDDETE